MDMKEISNMHFAGVINKSQADHPLAMGEKIIAVAAVVTVAARRGKVKKERKKGGVIAEEKGTKMKRCFLRMVALIERKERGRRRRDMIEERVQEAKVKGKVMSLMNSLPACLSNPTINCF